MKRFVLLILLIHATAFVLAQVNDSTSVTLDDNLEVMLESQLPPVPRNPSSTTGAQRYSTEQITIRKFDQRKWKEIVGSGSYTDTGKQKHSKSANQKQREGVENQRSGPRSFDNSEDEDRYEYDSEEESTIDLGWLGPVGQIIFYVALAAVIIMIVTQVIRNTSFKANPKRPSISKNNAEEITDITELDTDQLIQKALAARDYKLAIRLYFLDLLKKLNETGVIVWTKEKTNRDYLSELFSKQYHYNEVRKLTQAYERVWYGEHVPSEEHYRELRDEFREINQKFKES